MMREKKKTSVVCIELVERFHLFLQSRIKILIKILKVTRN